MEVFKIIAAFLGAAIGGLGALLLKEWLERKRVQNREYQTRWLPLFSAARLLRERLAKLTEIYRTTPPQDRWREYTWTDENEEQRPFR